MPYVTIITALIPTPPNQPHEGWLMSCSFMSLTKSLAQCFDGEDQCVLDEYLLY